MFCLLFSQSRAQNRHPLLHESALVPLSLQCSLPCFTRHAAEVSLMEPYRSGYTEAPQS